METNELLEPELLFKNRLKDAHHQNAEKYFDDLTKESGVNVEENRITIKNYNQANAQAQKYAKKASSSKGLRTFFIILMILGFAAAVISIPFFINGSVGIGVALAVGGIVFGVGFMLLDILVAKKKVKEAQLQRQKYEEKALALRQEAEAQMAALNALFDEACCSELMQKTTPLIKLDRTFNVNKLEQLIKTYDYAEINGKDVSVLGIQSGSILGNPFIIMKKLCHSMVPHTYVGEITYTYTRTVSNGNGGTRTVVCTDTLTATVTKPKPAYETKVQLIYGNEAAPNLSFSRQPSNIGTFKDQEAIDKYCRKHEKDLQKVADAAMKKGKTFTPLGNSEFELFFNALDRDHEVEFRLLFTPLAQKSMLQLLKSKDGYGDDFAFWKEKKINTIMSTHSQGKNIFAAAEDFQGFDYDSMRKYFLEYNDNYFKSIFYDLAPLLSIPLYQQHKSRDYIYQGTIKSNLPSYEHQIAANRFSDDTFAHPKTKTRVILNTILDGKDGDADRVKVKAYSHDEIEHVDYISKMGRDGRMHSIPVVWYDYPDLENEGYLEVKDSGGTRKEFKSQYAKSFSEYCSKNSSGEYMSIDRGIISFPIKKGATIDVQELKKFMVKKS